MRPRSPARFFGARASSRALLLIGLALASAQGLAPAGGGAAFAACDDPFPVFHANTGQADERFRFLTHSPEAILALAYDEAILIRNTGGPPAAISMKLVGARWRPRMVGLEDRLGEGAARTAQAHAVCLDGRPSYSGVRYRDVYPGIDLVFYPGRGGFEFDFLLSAGTYPRPVLFELEGVDSLVVDRLGNILLNLPEPGGRMKLLRPTFYQIVDGEKRAVEGGYTVQGDRVIGFEVGSYDRRLPLVIDPVLVYASSSAAATPETTGVLESPDGGRTWKAGGLAGRSVRSLVVDPVTPFILYAGTQGEGVFKSLDGGRTWSSRNNRLASLTVNALAVDPKLPDRVYAATSGGLYRSADGGASWTPVGPNLPNPVFRSVAIDPETGSTHAADDVWVAKSDDEGATWTYSTVAGDHVTSIAIDPSSPSTLYAGVFYASPRGGGVYRSADGGLSWRLVSGSVVNPSGRQYDVNVVAVARSGATGVVYAGTSGGGVFRSANGGTTWEAVNEGLGRVSVTALVVDPLSPSTLFAAVEGRGVFKSVNGGRKWTETTAGLGPMKPAALAIDPVHPERVFAGLLAQGAPALASQTDLAWNR